MSPLPMVQAAFPELAPVASVPQKRLPCTVALTSQLEALREVMVVEPLTTRSWPGVVVAIPTLPATLAEFDGDTTMEGIVEEANNIVVPSVVFTRGLFRMPEPIVTELEAVELAQEPIT